MRLPTYRLHRASGQAVVTLSGRDHYLGPHGTALSREAYRRIIGEYQSTGRAAVRRGHVATVAELADAFLSWATRDILPRRSGRSSYARLARSVAVVVDIYGSIPAGEFGAPELLVVRDAMVSKRWTRGEVNRCVTAVRRCWGWGVLHRYCTGESHAQLRAVRAIRGRTPGVAERPAKYIPPLRDVVAAGRHMLPDLRDFCLALWWCGARPSELIGATAADLRIVCDGVRARSLSEHKTDWHGGGDRVVLMGPRCCAVLARLIATRPTGPLFRRRDGDRRGRTLGNSIRAVRRSCLAAGVRPWTLYSLRRAAATRWVGALGDTQARRLLGHVAGGALSHYDQSGPDVRSVLRVG